MSFQRFPRTQRDKSKVDALVSGPKRFSGLFCAAPSIALANLLVIVVAKGHAQAQREATGMIVGAVAMCCACALGVVLIKKYRARRGSVALCASWLVFAEAGYLLFLR